jgi:HSP20 family protein
MKLIPLKRKKSNVAAPGADGARSLGRVRPDMDVLADPWSVFDRVLSGVPGLRWRPSVDVVDRGHALVVRAELPGIDPKEVDLSLSGRTLTISGEKRHEKEEKDEGLYRSECSYGAFRRSVELPPGIDPDQVSAEFVNGVLTVRVKKSTATQARRIPVSRN